MMVTFMNDCTYYGGNGFCMNDKNRCKGYRYAIEYRKCPYHSGGEKKCIGFEARGGFPNVHNGLIKKEQK